MNTCDICGVEQPSGELVWVTADDFEPRADEVVRWSFIELGNVDAACERCYREEVIL